MTARDDIPLQEIVLPLAAEDVTITKQEVVKGLVRVHVLTGMVEEHLTAELKTDDVEVRHVAINRYLAHGEERPLQRTENGVTIIPVFEEIAVLEKRLLLKEEIHIHRHSRPNTVDMPVTLRKQRVETERLNPDGTSTSPATENDT